jgi:hypothetical protein
MQKFAFSFHFANQSRFVNDEKSVSNKKAACEAAFSTAEFPHRVKTSKLSLFVSVSVLPSILKTAASVNTLWTVDTATRLGLNTSDSMTIRSNNPFKIVGANVDQLRGLFRLISYLLY